MNFLWIAFFLLFSVQSQAGEQPKRWNNLMKLVNQEIKLLQKAKTKGVEIKYRMLELYSEKLKLIHEKDNSNFLNASRKVARPADKGYFFKNSTAFYEFTKAYGLKILKEETRNSRKSEIYYALGLNSRDYGKDNITEKFLLESIKHAPDHKLSLKHHSQTALADFYYNEKRYPEAIKYYQLVVKNEKDDWLTKHLFNLSWCLLKNKEFNKSIDMMRLSYTYSKNPNYINLQEQILDHIGSLYVFSGRPLDGLDFYISNENNPVPHLIKLARKSLEKGHEKETKQILMSAQDIIVKKDHFKYQEDLLHTFLDFYRHYSRFYEHEKIAEKLVVFYRKVKEAKKKNIQFNLKDEAIEKLRDTAGFIQVKISKDIKKNDLKNYNKDELKLVLNYFNHLIKIDPKRKGEYLYFTAETYFSVQEYSNAANSYMSSVEFSLKNNEKIFLKKPIDSLLSLTSQDVLPEEENRNVLLFTYRNHISIWPTDPRSILIYPKLFEIYLRDSNDNDAAQVLTDYSKASPENLKDQQLLMTKILDLLIEKKATEKIAIWISTFRNGFLKFPKDFLVKTEVTLGNLLFNSFQELSKDGKHKDAAKGFTSLLENKLYPKKIKGQAAYFASLSFLESGNTKKSLEWQKIALSYMDSTDWKSKIKEQVKIAERMYLLQDFNTSSEFSAFLVETSCKNPNPSSDRAFEIAIMTSIVQENVVSAEKMINDFKKCLTDTNFIKKSKNLIAQHHMRRRSIYDLKAFVYRAKSEQLVQAYFEEIQKWYWETEDLNLKIFIKTELNRSNLGQAKLWGQEMHQFDQLNKDIIDYESIKIWQNESFDPDLFNQSLERYLISGKNIFEKHKNLMSSSQPELNILVTSKLSTLYENMAKNILSFNPNGLSPKIIKDFKSSMKNIAGEFMKASRKLANNLSSFLNKTENLFSTSRDINKIEDVPNPIFSFLSGINMDKVEGLK